MAPKKASAKQQTYSRLSLASGLQGSAALPAPASQEPWRDRKPKGRKRGKGRR